MRLSADWWGRWWEDMIVYMDGSVHHGDGLGWGYSAGVRGGGVKHMDPLYQVCEWRWLQLWDGCRALVLPEQSWWPILSHKTQGGCIWHGWVLYLNSSHLRGILCECITLMKQHDGSVLFLSSVICLKGGNKYFIVGHIWLVISRHYLIK